MGEISINEFEDSMIKSLNKGEYSNKKRGSSKSETKLINLSKLEKTPFLPLLLSLGLNSINDNFTYSENEFSPFSFLKSQTKQGFVKNSVSKLEYPAPSYIKHSDLDFPPDVSKEAIFMGLRIDEKIGLVLIDEKISQKFKGLMSKMLKSAMSNFFTKKPISLPITIFEPKSMLQRITDYFSFAPEFLSQASNEKDPIERLKLTITFSISGLYTAAKQLKPFNPLLGETFQGVYDDESSIYCEQISHYPTVARFYLKDINNLYCFHGYYEFISVNKNFGKKLTVAQTGPNNVDFIKQNCKIVYNLPKINMMNCDSDIDRSSYWKSVMVFVDIVNNLKAIIKFGKAPNVNNFEGYIIKFTYPKNYKFIIKDEIIASKKFLKEKNPQFISRIKGNWLESIFFDEKSYWSIEKNKPSIIKPVEEVIPSDCRFREDLVWLFRSFNTTNEEEKQKYLDLAQNWKYLLENTQRNDRELRKKYKK